MKSRYALTLALAYLSFLALTAAIGAALWTASDPAERAVIEGLLARRASLVVVIALFALAPIAWLHRAWFAGYPRAAQWLADETRIVLSTHPSHRIAPSGALEMRQLAGVVNQLADHCEAGKRDIESKIAEAQASLEDERNRLAALMAELSLSVVLCNPEGRIILYNERARRLLGRGQTEDAGWIGLGRSVFGVLDRNLVVHALEDIRHRLSAADSRPVTNLITSAGSKLIRLQVAPVLDRERAMTGFILTMDDVTQSVETSNQRDLLLRSLTEKTRAALANIRAAVETQLAYPAMKPEHNARFTGIVADEASKLSTTLDRTLAQFSDYVKTRLPIEAMHGADLVAISSRRIADRLGMVAAAGTVDAELWLRVDSYSIAQTLTYLAARLRREYSVAEVALQLSAAARFAHLEINWQGPALAQETVSAWQQGALVDGGEESLLSVNEVVERHGAEIVYRQHGARSSFRIMLPLSEPTAVVDKPPPLESRPEFYDFDLFNQPGQTAALDDRLLSELAYTVFDTETTGLEPSAGDEIISIGAVRVVNGRLLTNETFDQLIDPRRSLPRASTAVHGITPAMLRGQPAIAEVLPKFSRFCEDTVLVAHNAAFDMRFLQLKEEATGIRFSQPVLDTLLLSPVMHPFDPNHQLEAIAQRLGIDVTGRHTALGDAIVTAEIFLRMVPVLAAKGVRTLREAREASRKTYYARVSY